MQALVFDGPAPDAGATRVASMPAPEPGAGEVSIDVRYAGLNFIDVMARRGDPGYVASWPFVPGLEVAGAIRKLGSDVDQFEVGDRVAALTGSGGLAQVAIAPAQLAVAVPPELELERAAAAPGALTTAALLLGYIGRMRPGESVLAHSAGGGVGQAIARLAQLAGAGLVLGTVGSSERAAPAERAGYAAAFPRGPQLVAKIMAQTDGRGVDLILDPQGTQLLAFDLEVAAPGARIVLFGNASGADLAALPPPARLFASNASIGAFSLSRLAASAPERVAGALSEVVAHLAAGRLTVEITQVDGLARAAEAQQALAESRAPSKQIVQVS